MLDVRSALQIHTGNYNYVQAISEISFLHTCINYVAIGVSLVDRSDHASCDNTTPTACNTVSLATDGVDLLPMHGSSHVHVHQPSPPQGIPVPNSQLMNN